MALNLHLGRGWIGCMPPRSAPEQWQGVANGINPCVQASLLDTVFVQSDAEGGAVRAVGTTSANKLRIEATRCVFEDCQAALNVL